MPVTLSASFGSGLADTEILRCAQDDRQDTTQVMSPLSAVSRSPELAKGKGRSSLSSKRLLIADALRPVQKMTSTRAGLLQDRELAGIPAPQAGCPVWGAGKQGAASPLTERDSKRAWGALSPRLFPLSLSPKAAKKDFATALSTRAM